jgi:nucleoside-diphosphate-sugar epimerase
MVLVTGGSGFLGINMVRHLLRKGESQIRVLDLAPFDYPEAGQVEFLAGDIRDRDQVARAMAGVKWVIHTAAALPLYKPADILSTEVEGTRILLEAARSAGVERFVHISSTAVYGIPDHHPLLEDDKLDGVGAYGQAKIDAEAVCREFRGHGMCIPVLRPKSFIGPERLGVFALFYDWARDARNFPMIGSGNNRYQLLDVSDLCDAIGICLTQEAARVNDVFNIGAREFTTMREDYQAVLDEAGFGKRIIGFPARPVIVVLRLLEKMHLSPLYKWVYETACEDSFVSIEKAERVLGFNPQFSNKQALVRNFQWYMQNLEHFKNRSGVSHRVPWKQGILALIKHFF